MAGAIAWSVELLEDAVQAFFLRLAVFLGGWTAEAAEAVGTAIDKRTGESADLLETLVDASLVVQYAAPGHGTRRFRLLEPIREDGLERLEASGELEAARRRHAAYFLALAEAAEPELTGVEQLVWLDQLEADLENLRAALRWAAEQGRESTLSLRLSGALGRFWEQRGYLGEGRAWLERLLTQDAGCSSPAVRAKALQEASRLAFLQSEYDRARALAEEGLRLHRQQGDRAGEALCLNTLGLVGENLGEFARATALFEESLAIYRELGDRRGIAWAVINLGCVWDHQGNYRRARVRYKEALALFRARGVRRELAAALGHIAPSVATQGDYAGATAMLEESLPVLREVGDTPRVAQALGSLGTLAWQQGDATRAVAHATESLALGRRLGHKQAIAQALHVLGIVALLEGDTAQARRHLEEILTLFPGNALPKIRALALVTLGDVARAEGDPLQARARYEASLACAKRCGNDLGVAQALEGFAQVAMHAGQAAWAVRLVGVGAVLREAAGTPLAPVECQAVEGLMARARAALGDDMYEGERAAGRMLTLEYAIGAIADQDVPGWTPRAHGSSAHRA